MSNRARADVAGVAGLAALQADLEAILTESAKSAAARCIAVCRERFEEERRLASAEQVAELNNARARLEEALAGGEEMQKCLEPYRDPLPGKRGSTASTPIKAPITVNSFGTPNVAQYFDVGKTDSKCILRSIQNIRTKLKIINSEEPSLPISKTKPIDRSCLSRPRGKTQMLDKPDPASIMQLFKTRFSDISRSPPDIPSLAPSPVPAKDRESSLSRADQAMQPPVGCGKDEALSSGIRVQVLQPFEGNSSPEMKQTLKEGCHGVVRRMDKDGDALIDYFVEGQSGATISQWVLKRDFKKMDIKRAPQDGVGAEISEEDKVSVVKNGRSSIGNPADVFARISEAVRQTTAEADVGQAAAAAHQAAKSPVRSYDNNHVTTYPDNGRGRWENSPSKDDSRSFAFSTPAVSSAAQAPMKFPSPKAAAAATMSRTMPTSPSRNNAESPLSASLTSTQTQAPLSASLASTQTQAPLSASLASTQTQLPSAASYASSNSAGEAARAYAARNAELGRCLAEITADLQRACIISSSCKSSLRLGSNSPLKREAIPTTPLRATSPISVSPSARRGVV